MVEFGEPEAYRDDELRRANITAKERLERIESLLAVINDKLTSKADKADVVALEVRLRSIEVEGSSVARKDAEVMRTLERDVERDFTALRQEIAAHCEVLRADHNRLAFKVNWLFGVLAAVIFFGDIALRFLNK